MGRKRAKYVDNDTVSDVFRYLLNKSGKTIIQISTDTKIPLSSLYSISSRKSQSVNIRNLKKLADYFGEDLSIFCGLINYTPPLKLTTEQQMVLDDYSTLTTAAQIEVIGLLKRLRENPENIARLIP